ncbi:hypothetical protein DF186_21235, partial [Enterococcus hirae]
GIKFGLFYVVFYLNLLIFLLFVTVFYLGGLNIFISYLFISEFFEIIKVYGVFGIIIDIFIMLVEIYLFLFFFITVRWILFRS